jgi:hypothetical protein
MIKFTTWEKWNDTLGKMRAGRATIYLTHKKGKS